MATVFAPLPALPADAVGGFGFTRLAGPNRYATAALLAEEAFPAGAKVAVLASGDNYPDALSAAYLAGIDHAPILLVNREGPLPPETVVALAGMKTEHVILVGLDSAISRRAQLQLEGMVSTGNGSPLAVTRIGGQDRYDTSNVVDETPGAGAVGTVDGRKTAVIASGLSFADALASGPLAYARQLPIVLTDPRALSSQAAQTLQDLGIQQVVVAGGDAALQQGVVDAITSLGLTVVDRFAGTDRSDTSRLIANWAIAHLGFTQASFDLASGDPSFSGADALALAPLAAAEDSRPILLLDGAGQTGTGVPQFVRDNHAGLASTNANTLAGGVGPAPDRILDPIYEAFLYGPGVTVLPELVGATIVATTTVAQASLLTPAGTVVRFIFDSPVDPHRVSYSHFLVYDYAAPNVPVVGAAGAGSGIDSADPDAVFVRFPVLTTLDAAHDLSLAAVVPGAVEGAFGLLNPVGVAPIGAVHQLSTTPGVTEAPNALDVGGYRPAASDSTALDVVFDVPAFQQQPFPDSTGFSVVYADQSGAAAEADCTAPAAGPGAPSGGAVPGGDGTTVMTVVCPDDPATTGVALTATQIARVVVHPGTVGTLPATDPADRLAGYLQAVRAPRRVAAGPDLLGGVLVPSSVPGGDDDILVSLDKPVFEGNGPSTLHPPSAGRFLAVTQAGSVVSAIGVTPVSGSDNQILVLFPGGVGAFVVAVDMLSGAVVAADGGQSQNVDDEIPITGLSPIVVRPGLVAGPSLQSATLSPIRDAFGNPLAESALLSFDQALSGATAPDVDVVHGYDADGTELTCARTPFGAEPNGWDISDNPYPDASHPATLQCDEWADGSSSAGHLASLAQQSGLVLVTIDRGAVTNAAHQRNPEGAVLPTGGSGTPNPP
jgi:putative cell wall-binding protein